MPRFNNISFYQNRPKIKFFLQKKIQNFRTLGGPPPDPQFPSAAGGPVPIPPIQLPPLQISGYAPDSATKGSSIAARFRSNLTQYSSGLLLFYSSIFVKLHRGNHYFLK